MYTISMTGETVALAKGIDTQAHENFSEARINVVEIPSDKTGDALAGFVNENGVTILAPSGSGPEITPAVYDANPQVHTVAVFGKGEDHISKDVATERMIAVTNSPEGNSRSVAELTIGAMFDMTRQISLNDRKMRQGGFPKGFLGNHLLEGKSLGIDGMGAVGRILARKAMALGMEVFSYDPYATDIPEGVNQVDTLEALATLSRFLSINVPATKETIGSINSEIIGLMPERSYISQTCRDGVLVTEDALDALRKRHLAGAFIDVHPKPMEDLAKSGEPFESPYYDPELADLNIVESPHNGASTVEDKVGIADEVSRAAIDIQKGSTVRANNIFSVELGEVPQGTTRLWIGHINLPGVLQPIIDAIGEMGLNRGDDTLRHESTPMARVGEKAIDSININTSSGGLADQETIDQLLGIAEAQDAIIRARAIHNPNDR